MALPLARAPQSRLRGPSYLGICNPSPTEPQQPVPHRIVEFARPVRILFTDTPTPVTGQDIPKRPLHQSMLPMVRQVFQKQSTDDREPCNARYMPAKLTGYREDLYHSPMNNRHRQECSGIHCCQSPNDPCLQVPFHEETWDYENRTAMGRGKVICGPDVAGPQWM